MNDENIEETLKHAFRVYSPLSISSDVKAILADPKTQNIDANTSHFWILGMKVGLWRREKEKVCFIYCFVFVLARALGDFVEKEKKLPLEGSIPDMTSTTDGYIALQRV